MRAWSVLSLSVALTVAAAALSGCSGSKPEAPPGPDPKASAMAAQKLCYVFQYVGESCRASQDLVEVGERTLKVDAVIHHQVDLPGGAARNVAYSVTLGTEPVSAPVEILGKGTGPDDALDRAAQEWAALAGTAIVDAVRDSGRSEAVVAALKAGKRAPADATASASIAVGPFHAYPGIPDIRGAMQKGPRVDHEAILGVLVSHLSELDASRPHTLSFSLQNAGQPTCDKAEIDGKADARACSIIASYGWPSPVSPYQVRQVYLLRPGAAPATPAPDTDAPTGDTDASGDTDAASP